MTFRILIAAMMVLIGSMSLAACDEDTQGPKVDPQQVGSGDGPTNGNGAWNQRNAPDVGKGAQANSDRGGNAARRARRETIQQETTMSQRLRVPVSTAPFRCWAGLRLHRQALRRSGHGRVPHPADARGRDLPARSGRLAHVLRRRPLHAPPGDARLDAAAAAGQGKRPAPRRRGAPAPQADVHAADDAGEDRRALRDVRAVLEGAAAALGEVDEIVLFDELREILTEATSAWIGLPVNERGLEKTTREIAAMLDQAGSVVRRTGTPRCCAAVPRTGSTASSPTSATARPACRLTHPPP